MVSPGGDLFFHSKRALHVSCVRSARFACMLKPLIYALFCIFCTIARLKWLFYISTIYNIYPLYISIQFFFYIYIYKINRAIVRMPYITAFESCSNRVKIVYQIV